MVRKRVHKLKAVISTGDDYFDDNHNLIKGDSEIIEFDCRYLINTKSLMTRGEDGNMVEYSAAIYADRGVKKIPYGTTVELKNKATGEVEISGKVVGYSKAQMYTEIFI